VEDRATDVKSNTWLTAEQRRKLIILVPAGVILFFVIYWAVNAVSRYRRKRASAKIQVSPTEAAMEEATLDPESKPEDDASTPKAEQEEIPPPTPPPTG